MPIWYDASQPAVGSPKPGSAGTGHSSPYARYMSSGWKRSTFAIAVLYGGDDGGDGESYGIALVPWTYRSVTPACSHGLGGGASGRHLALEAWSV